MNTLNYKIHLILNSKNRFLVHLFVILFIYSTIYKYSSVLCMNVPNFIQETVDPFLGQQETIETLKSENQKLLLDNLRLQNENNTTKLKSIIDQLESNNLEVENERLRLKIKELKHKLYLR